MADDFTDLELAREWLLDYCTHPTHPEQLAALLARVRAEDLEFLRLAVSAACTCGGCGPDDDNLCAACAVWHMVKQHGRSE